MGDLPFVFGDGRADKPDLVLVGEAPGEQESLQGRPFVGAAGKILDHFLTVLGLERQNIYITNVVKQRPCRRSATGRVVNRPPSPEEIALFRPWLLEELQLIAPSMVVTLGNVPLQTLFHPMARIGDKHGECMTASGEHRLFALYHPAATIYNRSLVDVYEADLLKLKALL